MDRIGNKKPQIILAYWREMKARSAFVGGFTRIYLHLGEVPCDGEERMCLETRRQSGLC